MIRRARCSIAPYDRSVSSQTTPAATSPEVRITDDALTYRGPIDLDEGGPVVEHVFARSRPEVEALVLGYTRADPRAIDGVVRALPMSLGMIDALAMRCVERSPDASAALAAGEGAPDVRWMRALARSHGPAPVRREPEPAPTLVVSPPTGDRVMALRAFGRDVVALSCPQKYGAVQVENTLHFIGHNGVHRVHTFSTDNGAQRALPLPLVASDELLWLSVRAADGSATIETWSIEGELLSSTSTTADSAIQRISLVDGALWLHCEQHHTRVAPDGTRESIEHQDRGRSPVVIDGALLSFSRQVFDGERRTHVSRSGQWIALDASLRRESFVWDRPAHQVVASEGRAFVASDDGVFVVAPFAAPRMIADGSACYAIGALRGRVAFVVRSTLTVLDARSLDTVLSVELPSESYPICVRVHMSEAVVVIATFTRAYVVDYGGKLLWDSGERREPVAVTLRDGTTVVSAGELVAAFARDGTHVATNCLAYDGQLVGATDAHAIFGPISGGVAITEPDALYAIDHRARVVDALPKAATGGVRGPVRVRYGGGSETDSGTICSDRVLVVDGAGALVEWVPRDTQARVFAESKRVPSARGVVETRFHTSNPRDDWPLAGVELNAVTFYAEDCTWRGTTGVSPERAVIVRNGAIATLVRCKIDGDGGGARALQSSTLILCDCVFDRSQIDVEPGSHLLVFGSDARVA